MSIVERPWSIWDLFRPRATPKAVKPPQARRMAAGGYVGPAGPAGPPPMCGSSVAPPPGPYFLALSRALAAQQVTMAEACAGLPPATDED